MRFSPHLPNDELKQGIKTGRYFKGVLRVKANDRQDCSVILLNFSGKDRKTVTVKSELNTNRAIDGDIVAIELVNSPLKGEKEKEKEYLDIEGIAEEEEEEEEEEAGGPKSLYGKVVGILQHTSEQYAGSIDPSSIRCISTANAAATSNATSSTSEGGVGGGEGGEDDAEYYIGNFIP